MSEFEKDFRPKPELPPRMRLYNEVDQLLTKRLEKSWHIAGRVPLAIPRLEIDSASFGGVYKDEENGLISIDLELYFDGSPRVLEGDDEETRNEYILQLGRESDPFLAQAETVQVNYEETKDEYEGDESEKDTYFTGREMQKLKDSGVTHSLTDEECEELIQVLKKNTKE